MARRPVRGPRGQSLRILVVTHDYEPMQSARAMRWTSIAKALATQGHDVTVVCQGSAGSSPGTGDSPAVFHVEAGWLGRLRNRAAPGMSGPSGLSGTRGVFRAVYDRTWRRLYWPDYAFAWRKPARRVASRLHRADPFDALVTVSPPFTSHRVGLEMHRHFPGLLWLVDLGDPFSFDSVSSPNNPLLYRRMNRKLEEAVLNSADVLTTVNEPLRDLWVKHFPDTVNKFHVVPPLALKTDPDPARFLPATPARKMVFAGTLYKTAGPAPLFRLVERIAAESRQDWELHVLGDPWEVRDEIDANRHLIGSRVHLHGKVPRAKAERAVVEADVLVSLGMRSPIASPSKLFHYFGTGKPVVHVPYAWPDALAPFLEKYARSQVITAFDVTNAGPLPPDLLRLVKDSDKPPQVPAWLAEHSSSRIAAQYASLLSAASK